MRHTSRRDKCTQCEIYRRKTAKVRTLAIDLCSSWNACLIRVGGSHPYTHPLYLLQPPKLKLSGLIRHQSSEAIMLFLDIWGGFSQNAASVCLAIQQENLRVSHLMPAPPRPGRVHVLRPLLVEAVPYRGTPPPGLGSLVSTPEKSLQEQPWLHLVMSLSATFSIKQVSWSFCLAVDARFASKKYHFKF